MKVKKRDKSIVSFYPEKIRIALRKANAEVGEDHQITEGGMDVLIKDLKEYFGPNVMSVEDIQDYVVDFLEYWGYRQLYTVYSNYREARAKIRQQTNTTDGPVQDLLTLNNKENENANKDSRLLSTQRDLIAGEVSKDLARRLMIPRDIIKAHDDGIIHVHDLDYIAQKMYNCCLVNLEDMLQNGTVINKKKIDKPKSFQTACTIATQIVAQVASSQYGGQTISLAHISPFVDASRQKVTQQFLKELEKLNVKPNQKIIDEIVAERLQKEVESGVQTIQYQLETLSSTNGQSPFVSINMDLNEAPEGQAREDLAMVIQEVLKQRIKGVKNENGIYTAPAFPKLLYVLDENNIHPNSEYYWLTRLAAECSSKRLVPDYISAKKMRELKHGNVYPPMGCRSFLTPNYKVDGEYKFYGRFNQGVTTLNLVDVAMSSAGDFEVFDELLKERMDLIKRMQLIRYEHLKGTVSDVAPILWQHGAIARLEPGAVIDEMLTDCYSTSSIGIAGMFECVQFMLCESHTTPKGAAFATKILNTLKDMAAEWKAEHNIDFSVYGTPLESTTYKFALALKRRFGEIKDITDKDYITNSYHINVKEPIDAFSKLTKEAVFQDLTPGGAISYVELPDMSKNLDAVMAIITHMYHTTMYAEINVAADTCLVCDYQGEMKFDDKGKWYCPMCHNDRRNKIQITRRVCGYIGSNETNKGRTKEIQDRVRHLGDY